MLALADGNVRAGNLSLKELKKRLKGIVSENNIEEAVEWLSSSNVRLVTPTQFKKNIKLYELAHERIIPPLRRVAVEKIPDVRIAQNTLDYRFNEWITYQSRQYLLNRKEYQLISNHRSDINYGQKHEQIERFLQLSNWYYLAKLFVLPTIIMMFLIAYAGYRSYQWYDQRTDTQIKYVRSDLNKIIQSGQNQQISSSVSFLLPILKDESNQDLIKNIWSRIDKEADNNKFNFMKLTADIGGKLPDNEFNSKFWDAFLNHIKSLPEKYRALLLISAGNTYKQLSKDEELKNVLKELKEIFENNKIIEETPLDALEVIKAGTDLYRYKNQINELVVYLDKIENMAKKPGFVKRKEVLESLTEAYAKLSRIDKTLTLIKENTIPIDKSDDIYTFKRNEDITNSKIFEAMVEGYSNSNNPADLEKTLEQLRQLQKDASALYVDGKLAVYKSIINACGNLPDKSVAAKGLKEFLDSMSKDVDYYSYLDLLEVASEHFIKLDDTEDGLNFSNRLQDTSRIKYLGLIMKKHSNYDEDANLIGQIEKSVDTLQYDANKVFLKCLIADVYSKNNRITKASTLIDEAQTLYKNQEKIITSEARMKLQMALLQSYIYAGKIDSAKNMMPDIKRKADDLNFIETSQSLLKAAKLFNNLGETEDEEIKSEISDCINRAKTVLNKLDITEKLDPEWGKNLVKVVKLFAELKRWKDAYQVTQLINDDAFKAKALTAILLIYNDGENRTKVMDSLAQMFLEN